MKILLVEDTQLPAMMASTLLKNAGHVVELASTGEAAIQLAGASPYDVIFMDIGLPDMEGFDAAQKIVEVAPGAKVIGLTAHSIDGDYRKKALWSGFTDIIAKPLSKDYVDNLASKLG